MKMSNITRPLNGVDSDIDNSGVKLYLEEMSHNSQYSNLYIDNNIASSV